MLQVLLVDVADSCDVPADHLRVPRTLLDLPVQGLEMEILDLYPVSNPSG